MVIQTGIDIVKIDRFTKILERRGNTFLNKFLCEEEIKMLYESGDIRPSSVAGLWAAKEAISKAIGFGIGDMFSFHDVLIYKDNFGCPQVTFLNGSGIRLGLSSSSISISHDSNFAIATALIIKSGLR